MAKETAKTDATPRYGAQTGRLGGREVLVVMANSPCIAFRLKIEIDHATLTVRCYRYKKASGRLVRAGKAMSRRRRCMNGRSQTPPPFRSPKVSLVTLVNPP